MTPSDALLLVRYLFGFRGENLSQGTPDPLGSRPTGEAIAMYLDPFAETVLDVDGNGEIKPFKDGLLVLRYLVELRGAALVQGIVDPQGLRSTVEDIEQYLARFIPSNP